MIAPVLPDVLELDRLPFGTITSVGLRVNDPEPAWSDLEAAFVVVPRRLTGYQWALGDLWIIAEGVYGEDASQLLEARALDPSDLQSYAWVARKFFDAGDYADESHPRWSLRRRPGVSWSHHRAVAGLVGESDEATALAVHLLDLAEADPEMTAADLALAVKDFRGEDDEEEDDDEVAFSVGSAIERLGRLHAKADNLLGDLPPEWKAERSLLTEAVGKIADTLHSARNRQTGGEPSASAEDEAPS